MKITKIGHCCLLIEVDGKRILTDPGMFTVDSHILENIDIVVITHEHGDHLHVDSMKELVKMNPEIQVVTNTGVGTILDEVGISYVLLEKSDAAEVCGITLQSHEAPHEEIFEEFGQVQNTGYFITERFFYPGDAYGIPDNDVEILALPVSGPWCQTSDVLKYVRKIQPKKAFPMHDGLLNEQGIVITHGIIAGNLKESAIEFIQMKSGDVEEF